METVERDVPRVRFNDAQIEMAHGAGGKASRRLVEGLFVPLLANPILATLSDSALSDFKGSKLATTADGYVVKPLRFPGGSIGELAVNGTVNDLAVAGAVRPLGLMASFILEAGLPGEALRAEVEAMADAAARAGVSIVGGDTKVVEHGFADGMYIATFGFGEVDARANLGPKRIREGDRVLLSGPIGDHGITILLARGELDLEADLASDTRSVAPFVEALLDAIAEDLHWMRDPTRGGVATALNELVAATELGITLFEEAIPLRDEVRGACEILGLDPLHIANEGQILAVVSADSVDGALGAMRSVAGGEHAVCIGEVRAKPARAVLAVTAYGGSRLIDMLVGDPLPRIC
ncbi:MAG TPA: hydrogenase expression/formation protein HypE [Candidatus Cybelea sp.]|jgi:hydrogenase expression/formation protein HypE